MKQYGVCLNCGKKGLLEVYGAITWNDSDNYALCMKCNEKMRKDMEVLDKEIKIWTIREYENLKRKHLNGFKIKIPKGVDKNERRNRKTI